MISDTIINQILFSFSSDKDERTDSRIRRKTAPPGIEPRVLRTLIAHSNHWATKPQGELRVNFRLSPSCQSFIFIFIGAEREENLIRNDPDKGEFTTLFVTIVMAWCVLGLSIHGRDNEFAHQHSQNQHAKNCKINSFSGFIGEWEQCWNPCEKIEILRSLAWNISKSHHCHGNHWWAEPLVTNFFNKIGKDAVRNYRCSFELEINMDVSGWDKLRTDKRSSEKHAHRSCSPHTAKWTPQVWGAVVAQLSA